MEKEPSCSYLVRIEGRVQGVWYRSWTEQQANKRDLCGWVKNLPDGAVEALVSGPESGVRQMLQDFQNGPPAAEVLSVEARECDPPAKTGFHLIKST